MPTPKSLADRRGFTLIELLVVIAIVAIIAMVVLVAINPSQRFQEFYLSKSKEQLGILVRATEAYSFTNNGQYPPDQDRNVPTEILEDLRGDQWPKAPWPGSVFDWDNIATPLPVHPPQEPYIQYSIRFCNIDGSNCTFPDFEWAEDFDSQSAVYYCISGPCRSHRDRPMNHPGYCIGNCPD